MKFFSGGGADFKFRLSSIAETVPVNAACLGIGRAFRRIEEMGSSMKELVQETPAAQNMAPAAKKKGGGLRAVWSNKKRRRWIILSAVVLAAGCWALRS